jgi:hypothetical protein
MRHRLRAPTVANVSLYLAVLSGCGSATYVPPPTIALADAPLNVRQGLEREAAHGRLSPVVIHGAGDVQYGGEYSDELGEWRVWVDRSGVLASKGATLSISKAPAAVQTAFAAEFGHPPPYVRIVTKPDSSFYQVTEYARHGPSTSVRVASGGQLIWSRIDTTTAEAPEAAIQTAARVLGVTPSPRQRLIIQKTPDGVTYLLPRSGNNAVRLLVLAPTGALLSDRLVNGAELDPMWAP